MKNTLSKILAFCLVMLFFFYGCTRTLTTGSEFDPGKCDQIKKGSTTKQEILTMFGPPYSKSTSSSGEYWTYMYSESQSSTKDTLLYVYGLKKGTYKGKMRSLSITFKDDVVKEYTLQEMGQ